MFQRSSKASRGTVTAVLALAMGTLVFGGCTTSGAAAPVDACAKSVQVANPMGHVHGHACTQNSECKYGYCKTNAYQLQGKSGVGVCTKDCSCGAGSACEDDNGGGLEFKCIKAPSGPGSECALGCGAGAGVCTDVNPSLVCTSSSSSFQSGTKICAWTK